MTLSIGSRVDIVDALVNECHVSYLVAVDFIQTYLAGAIERYEDYTRRESSQKFFFFVDDNHGAIQKYFDERGYEWPKVRDTMGFKPHYSLKLIEANGKSPHGHIALLGWLLEITK